MTVKLLLLFLCVHKAALASSSEVTCPPNYHRAGSRCYLLVQRQMNWLDGARYCEALGASLAATETEGEYIKLKVLMQARIPHLLPSKYAPGYGELPNFWMAGYYNRVKKNYYWHSSSPPKLHQPISASWSAHHRGITGDDTNCMYWSGQLKTWKFYPCHFLFYGVLCEHDPVPE